WRRRLSALTRLACCERLSSAMTIKPLGKWRNRTAELVLFRFCPPGPLARYVSSAHCASNARSFRSDQAARLVAPAGLGLTLIVAPNELKWRQRQCRH